jgi:hypothetical protein
MNADFLPLRVIAGLNRNPQNAGDTGIRRYDGAAVKSAPIRTIRVIRVPKKQQIIKNK